MVECVDRYYGEFKPCLRKTLSVKKWTKITENNYARQKQAILNFTPEEIFDWVLSSASESYLAPDYEILIMGKECFTMKITGPLLSWSSPFPAERAGR